MSHVRRLKESEGDFQDAVLTLARSSGWTAAHFHDSRRQVRPRVFVGDRDAAGFFDLVLTRDGVLILAELKSEKGRLTGPQLLWLEVLRAVAKRAPRVVLVRVWRPSDWDEIEQLLTTPRARRSRHE